MHSACIEKRTPIAIKDISWLWRTAYNCAIQGCSEWENAEGKVPGLFDLSREVGDAPTPEDTDADPYILALGSIL